MGEDTFIHETASVIGEVVIGDRSFVGPGASVRGDFGGIIIGDESFIEDNCVLHAKPDGDCVIGDHVTVGHGAILHGCTVGDWALIGMGAVVGQGAVIGEWAVIGEGAVVPQGKNIAARKIAMGIPAKEVSDVKDEYIERWTDYKGMYKDLAKDVYPNTLKRKD
ncbi:MAG: gamma carbonic anhydrase family protein [Methanobacteriota archaeon]|nr:MAG: gamma carbonic anhydrase family protein [Euryarchaeota archaeon]